MNKERIKTDVSRNESEDETLDYGDEGLVSIGHIFSGELITENQKPKNNGASST